MRNKLIPAGYIFLIKNDQILLSKRQNTGYMDGCWSVPAGHIEKNETASTGLCREVFEEINLNLKQENLSLVHVMSRIMCDPNRLDLFFECKIWDGEFKNMEPEKCAELKWFELNNLPDNLVDVVSQAINGYKEKIYYSEL